MFPPRNGGNEGGQVKAPPPPTPAHPFHLAHAPISSTAGRSDYAVSLKELEVDPQGSTCHTLSTQAPAVSPPPAALISTTSPSRKGFA